MIRGDNEQQQDSRRTSQRPHDTQQTRQRRKQDRRTNSTLCRIQQAQRPTLGQRKASQTRGFESLSTLPVLTVFCCVCLLSRSLQPMSVKPHSDLPGAGGGAGAGANTPLFSPGTPEPSAEVSPPTTELTRSQQLQQQQQRQQQTVISVTPSSSAPHGYPAPILRQRSNSEVDVDVWDADRGGGATYLPAIPSPRRGRNASPAPGPRRSSPMPAAANGAVVNGGGGGVAQQKLDMNEPLLSSTDSEGKQRYDGPAGEDSLSDPSADPLALRLDGGGDEDEADDEEAGVPSYQPPPVSHAHKLGQWMATGICGNDITSSCLYVTGLCVADAGVYAPICLLMVAFTLFLFRRVYGEAVTALPLNGGAYNVLLNVSLHSAPDCARA